MTTAHLTRPDLLTAEDCDPFAPYAIIDADCPPWPPTDADELAALDEYVEREHDPHGVTDMATATDWIMEIKEHSVAVRLGPDLPSSDEIIFGLYGDEDADMDAETIANARLIAAAPKLLAACEEAFEALGRDNKWNVSTLRLNILKAAIAKARDQ